MWVNGDGRPAEYINIQSATAEIRRGKNKEEETAGRKYNGLPYCTGWRGGATDKAFGLAINRSRLQILLEVTLRNNLRQVVHTYVSLSPSSITWYRPKGGDALWLGR